MSANKLETAAIQWLLACLAPPWIGHVYNYIIYTLEEWLCVVYTCTYGIFFCFLICSIVEVLWMDVSPSLKIDLESVLILSYLPSFIYYTMFSFLSRTAFGPNNAPSHVYSIAYFNNHIYFSDPGNRDIYRTNMTGHKTLYLGSYDYLSDIKIVEPRKGLNTCAYKHVSSFPQSCPV